MTAQYAMTKQEPRDGDIVGTMHYIRYESGPLRGEVRGMKVAARGKVLGEPYRNHPRGMWLVNIQWDSPVQGFISTGKDHKAYVCDLHLLKRTDAKR